MDALVGQEVERNLLRNFRHAAPRTGWIVRLRCRLRSCGMDRAPLPNGNDQPASIRGVRIRTEPAE